MTSRRAAWLQVGLALALLAAVAVLAWQRGTEARARDIRAGVYRP